MTEIRLGVRTTTGDVEGEEREETEIPPRERILALSGEVELPIPRASAVKIGGERAYALQRRGVAIEMPLRHSVVHTLEIRRLEPPYLELALHVSSGTYVRAIADALGGHCRTLRRTAVGPFRVEDADETQVLPPLAAVSFLPERRLAEDEARRVRSGAAVPEHRAGAIALTFGGELVAVGRGEDGRVRPETVIA